MSLFGPSRPKGITEEELYFVRGELQQAAFGHGAEALTDHQINEIVDRLKLCLDPDTSAAIAHKWKQADANEVVAVEDQLTKDTGLHLTPLQRDHVHRVLTKYLDINKVRSIF
jgi:hypothetical protein